MYITKIGGSPDQYEFDTLEGAMGKAWELAEEMCEFQGLDSSELGEWGDDEDTGWGVCPREDDGAYWPQVTAIPE